MAFAFRARVSETALRRIVMFTLFACGIPLMRKARFLPQATVLTMADPGRKLVRSPRTKL
jgi:hypothetical protein